MPSLSLRAIVGVIAAIVSLMAGVLLAVPSVALAGAYTVYGYRFRLLIPHQTGYPYAAGASGPIDVTVVG